MGNFIRSKLGTKMFTKVRCGLSFIRLAPLGCSCCSHCLCLQLLHPHTPRSTHTCAQHTSCLHCPSSNAQTHAMFPERPLNTHTHTHTHTHCSPCSPHTAAEYGAYIHCLDTHPHQCNSFGLACVRSCLPWPQWAQQLWVSSCWACWWLWAA